MLSPLLFLLKLVSSSSITVFMTLLFIAGVLQHCYQSTIVFILKSLVKY